MKPTSKRVKWWFRVWRKVAPVEIKGVYDNYPGGDFLDVGAFIGFFSMFLATKAVPGSTFVSLEPDRMALTELLANISEASDLFPHLRFCVLPVPAGTGAPVKAFETVEDGHKRFAIHEDPLLGGPSYTVDSVVSFLKLRPTLVKIDVEGAEFDVLTGATNTMKEFHPIIMLEVHPQWIPNGINLDDIRALLTRHNYSVSEIADRHWICQ